MENYMGYPMNMPTNNPAHLEMMYPDLYTKLHPHIKDIADSLSDDRVSNMTNEDIGRLTGEAISMSGVENDPPAGHNAGTIGDIARILLLRELFDRNRRRGFMPFFPPFLLFPYGGPYDEYRHYDRDMDIRHRWY